MHIEIDAGMKRIPLYLASLFSVSLLLAYGQQPQFGPSQHVAFETCMYFEGKGEYCRTGETARAFNEFLRPDWLTPAVDGFVFETGLDRFQPGKDTFKATWNEIGVLGNSRIRRIEYTVNGRWSGDLLVAERKDGLFVPLLKWAGPLPEIKPLRPGKDGVLGFSRDFGGNIPMVETWAWTASTDGPVRLDVAQALRDAIQKVSPIHNCYSTEWDWNNLQVRTWCWPGEWMNKPSVKYQMNASFDFSNGKLVPRRVELQHLEEASDIKRWP